ncbi:MAG: PhoH family protein [Clostridia bacterium]|nr:PhoH family protein [Clostridia bacterium]
MVTRTIFLTPEEESSALFGSLDRNMKEVEDAFGVQIMNRTVNGQNAIIITGEEEGIDRAEEAISHMRKSIRSSGNLSDQSVGYIVDSVKAGETEDLGDFENDCITVTFKGKPVKPKTAGQQKYVKAIEKNTIVFGIGPAGTGKTYLAVAMAVKALREHRVNRIILTRPAIEAGEKLGFLPGDLQSKIDPYLRPLYDALFDMMGTEAYQKQIEKGVIEIAPLAYMRGRTLDDSFIILDEAQNATPEQMKMFLTRLGFNSKMVITGDLTQTDLPYGQKSGLLIASRILSHVDDIVIHAFTERDVVRHKLVQKIILAYDKAEREAAAKKTRDGERIYRVKKN